MSRFLPTIPAAHRRNTWASFATFFLVLAGHVLLETARDALFLARLPAEHLPWMYLGIAATSVVIAGRASQFTSRGLAQWLVFSGIMTGVFWLLTRSGDDVWIYALYMWTGVFASVAITQLWIVLGHIFTVADGKRLFGFIGAGSLLGAIAGAGSATLLTSVFDAEHLLLVAGVLFVISAAGPAFGLRMPATQSQDEVSFKHDLASCLASTVAHPFIRRLAVMIILATITLKVTDYIFMAEVSRRVAPEALGSFFAQLYTALNVLGLLAQIFVTGWLMRRVGVQRSVLLLPILLVFGAVGLLVGGGIVAAIALKASDGTFKHSVHRTAVEVLWLPVPDRLRRHAKFFVSTLGERGAQALSSLLILGIVALGGSAAWLAVIAAITGIAWILVGLSMRSHYLDLFRRTLREGQIDTRIQFPELDLTSLEALLRALNSEDDGEVGAALRLLASQGRLDLVPALILYHPSNAVLVEALQLFAASGTTTFIPLARRLIDDPHRDPSARAAALRAVNSVQPDTALLRHAAEDDAPVVVATALTGLITDDALDDAERQILLNRLILTTDVDARVATLHAIERHPSPHFTELLIAFAQVPNVSVRVGAAKAMGRRPDPRFLPVLVDLLAHRDTRPDARTALVHIGPAAFEHLAGALGDDSMPYGVRRHLPRTLSRFCPRRAAPVLLARLLKEDSGMIRYKILRGLGRLKANNPQLNLPLEQLRKAIERPLRDAWQQDTVIRALHQGATDDPARATMGHELLIGLVRDKRSHTIERLFRLLGLAHPGEDFERIFRGLDRGDRRAAASGLELLEHSISADIRPAVLALLDQQATDDERRAASVGWRYALPKGGYDGLVLSLLHVHSTTLRSLAAHHAAELGIESAEAQVREIADALGDDAVGAGVLRRALAIFEGRFKPMEAAGAH